MNAFNQATGALFFVGLTSIGISLLIAPQSYELRTLSNVKFKISKFFWIWQRKSREDFKKFIDTLVETI